MSKQSTPQKRSGHRRGRSRIQSRKPLTKKQSTLGLRVLLAGILLAMGIWVLLQVPPGLLLLAFIVTLLVVIVLIWTALVLRPRPHMELTRQEIQKEPKEEPVRLASTDQAVAIRPVHLRDLIPFKHDEFEYFVGAVIEAAGVACDLKRVGGANDQGADLLGKDQFTRPFIVQCKRYFGHPVTPTEMRDLLGARSSIYHADIAWFVTTSTFSRGAERAAAQIRRTGKVVLIDGETLIGLIHTCWEKLPIQWQRRLIQIILASE